MNSFHTKKLEILVRVNRPGETPVPDYNDRLTGHRLEHEGRHLSTRRQESGGRNTQADLWSLSLFSVCKLFFDKQNECIFAHA